MLPELARPSSEKHTFHLSLQTPPPNNNTMEPPPHMLEYLLGPAMPYLPHNPITKTRLQRSPEEEWQASPLNPKNRIDCGRTKEEVSGWRLFRADFIRGRLSAVPTFALGRPPRRIDIYLGSNVDLECNTWRSLSLPLTRLVLTDGGCRDSMLAQHIVKGLGYWSQNIEGFAERYTNLPFASKIVVRALTQDARDMEFSLDAASSVEMQWVSAEGLRATWNIPPDSWPPVIDISELALISELHESITLVSTTANVLPRGQYVLKSTTSQPRCLYHELKQLLSAPSHPSIIPKPLAIATKKVQFGSKRGVCGILLPYYPAGNLAQALRPGSTIRETVDDATKFRWAYQIASALLHVQSSPAGYYSDLKLDNIMLVKRDGRHDAVLIDLEQRGAWFSWSPPEINRIAHVVYLADKEGPWIPAAVRERFRRICRAHLPAWEGHKQRRRPNYTDDTLGYNVCWKALSQKERGQAMSFMLGRALWCIFEMQASPNAAEFMGAEVFREADPDHRFPDMRSTPEEIGVLIYRCTSSAPEWRGEGRCVERRGDAVYPAGWNGDDAATAEEETMVALRTWWKRYEAEAEEYLEQRSVGGGAYVPERPSMAEIVDTLRSFGKAHGLLESK